MQTICVGGWPNVQPNVSLFEEFGIELNNKLSYK